MKQDLLKTNCPLEKTDAAIVVVDTGPALISDEEAAQAVGGSGPGVNKSRPGKPIPTKTPSL